MIFVKYNCYRQEIIHKIIDYYRNVKLQCLIKKIILQLINMLIQKCGNHALSIKSLLNKKNTPITNTNKTIKNKTNKYELSESKLKIFYIKRFRKCVGFGNIQ